MNPQPSISEIKEWADKHRCLPPTYSCTAPAGQPSNWHCRAVLLVPQPPASAYTTITADGAGKNKQEAKSAAASSLLVQLEQQGLRYKTAAPAGPAAAGPSTQQQVPAHNISCVNQLAEFLQAFGRGSYQVSYSDALRVPGTPDHRPQWTVDVQLLPFNSSVGSSSNSNPPKITAHGSGPNRSGAKHAAAAALLLHQDFVDLFAGQPNAAAALARAAVAAEAAAVPVPEAAAAAAAVARVSPAAATAAALREAAAAQAAAAAAAAAPAAAPAAPNYKNRLQELLQKAASKKLLGWDGWQLPTYSTKRSHEDQPSQSVMFTSTVTIQSPTGPASVTGTEPHTSKKEAEQHVAQLMLQRLEPDMLQAQAQRGVAAAHQVAAGAAAGLQAVFQQQQQQGQA